MGKKSQKTTTRTVYGNTTTTNPYVTATTNNKGTTASFQPGTALEAKLNAFTNALNSTTRQNLENNIINPLSNRNMLRSSQATDLYKNLSNQNNASLDSYINSLLSESQDNTARMMSNLLTMYMQGLGALNNAQNQSLQTSSGNATKTSNTTSSSDYAQQLAQIVATIAKAAMTA